MTFKARKVLSDCEIALEMLENEEDLERWRVVWAGAMALLRAVGHVLAKEDGRNPKLHPFVDAAYRRWKDDRVANQIFWNFIEEERNNILKQYHFNIYPMDQTDVIVIPDTENIGTDESSPTPKVFSITGSLYRPIVDGFCEGDDARDVYREALEWWKTELNAIEARMASSEP